MIKVTNDSWYAEDFYVGESIEDDAESIRQAMLLESKNLREDTMVSMREGISNEQIADRLQFYASVLMFK